MTRPTSNAYGDQMNKAFLALKVTREKRNLVLLPLVVVSLFALILLNYYTIKIIPAARAYINGESQYSKSQKNASAHLINYVYRCGPADYQLFLQELSEPLGDRQARVNLMTGGDDRLIRAGLLTGKIHPDDVMIR